MSSLSDFGGSKYAGTGEKCSYDAPDKSVSWWMVGSMKGVGAEGVDVFPTASIGIIIGESFAIGCVRFVVIWEGGNGRKWERKVTVRDNDGRRVMAEGTRRDEARR